MKTFIFNCLVPVSVAIDAETQEEAQEQLVTLKKYSITDPDGQRVDIEEDDIQSVDEA